VSFESTLRAKDDLSGVWKKSFPKLEKRVYESALSRIKCG